MINRVQYSWQKDKTIISSSHEIWPKIWRALPPCWTAARPRGLTPSTSWLWDKTGKNTSHYHLWLHSRSTIHTPETITEITSQHALCIFKKTHSIPSITTVVEFTLQDIMIFINVLPFGQTLFNFFYLFICCSKSFWRTPKDRWDVLVNMKCSKICASLIGSINTWDYSWSFWFLALPIRIHKRDEEGIEGIEVSHQHRELLLYLQLRFRGATPLCFHLLLLQQDTFRLLP